MRLVYSIGMIKSIALDATHFGTDQPTGVEVYADGLLPLLSKKLISKGCTVTWISHLKEKPSTVPTEVVWVHSDHKPLWSQRTLPNLLKVLEPDLYFTPSGIPPFRYKGKVAMTVHDMSVYLHPESYDWQERLRLRAISSRMVPRCACVITPSEYTKFWVEKIWKAKPERVTAVPHGFDVKKVVEQPITDLLASDSPIFGFVGRIETKKNLFPVIMAFNRLRLEQPARLVLAGGKGHGYINLIKVVKGLSAEVQKDIIMPGYITEEQKAWLMSHATALLIPSLLEGFGMPLLEAFSAQVPVLCSQSGALPEVAQNAAQYIQGDIATDWYLHMRDCLTEPALLKQNVVAGTQRLKEYSWEKTADRTATALLAAGS